MDKYSFRKKYKAQRTALTETAMEDMSLAISNRTLELPIWESTYYHVFLTISEKKEVNTEFLLHILQGRDKSIVVSKSNFSNHEMQHFLLQEHTPLAISDYGIPEPVEGLEVPVKQLDVIFVPLLTFDRNGNRLGYGKGFYDRFLKSCKKEAVFVGLSYFEAEDFLPHQSSDIPLNYCVTPSQIYSF
jgi:5-formyltetrahydrofolate cyclo-ligase